MDQPSIPGYENLKPIGKGGFSRVFEATQQKFGRQVAIKVLNFGVNDEQNRRAFARETTLMGRVSTHPNIVTVYDTAFSDQGQPCIVMELCSGGTIADRITEMGRLDAREVLDLGVAIASALEASHDTGVLHRDIKPQNILISDFGQAALSDFGISAFDDERPQTGDASGFTLHYAPPEVIDGAIATAQSDVYSLAATLYTAAAGQRPFATPGTKIRPGELARRVLLEEPAPLTNWGVPTALDVTIRRAMSKEPADRPASAGAFATELRAVYDFIDSPPGPAHAGVSPSAPATTDDLSSPQASAAGKKQPVPNLDEADTSQTVLRSDFEEQQRRDADAGAAQVEESADDDALPLWRRVSVWALPILVAVVGVGALWLLSGEGEEPTVAPPPTADVARAVDPVQAPDTPTDVTLQRLTPGEVLVTWGPGDDDVIFEVLRTDTDVAPVTVETNELVLSDIASNEQPCVSVTAIRGARLSNPSSPTCAAIASTWVEIFPDTCSVTACTIRLQVIGLPDNAAVTITVTDPEGNDLNGFSPDAYKTVADLNADGDAVDWRLTLGRSLPTGRYQVFITDDVGIPATGFLTVTE